MIQKTISDDTQFSILAAINRKLEVGQKTFIYVNDDGSFLLSPVKLKRRLKLYRLAFIIKPKTK